jgi:DNA-binding CsgD family transcriptional regulator
MNRTLRQALAAMRRHVRTVLLEQADKRDLPLTAKNVNDLADDIVSSMAACKVTVPTMAGPITYMQREVLHGIALGETTGQTAQRLCLSEHTVKSHKRHLYARLGVDTNGEAVAIGIGLGLIRVDKRARLLGSWWWTVRSGCRCPRRRRGRRWTCRTTWSRCC